MRVYLWTWCLAASVICAGASSIPTGVADHPGSAARPNLLLITLDTTRADHIGAYGYRHVDTPTIDAISEQGVRYERCYAPVPLTLSATPGSIRHRAPRLGEHSDEILAELGYDTAAIAGLRADGVV